MLATQPANGLLTARIDDATLPAGTYLLRARARDRAGNESSTDRRVDGQPMLATLPLRITTTLQAGLERTRMITRRIRHHGRRRKVRRPVTVLRSNPRVDYGEQVHMSGRLVMGDGRGLAGAQIQVLSRTETTPERLVGSLQTGADGTFRYVVTGSSTRTLRLVYAGSSIALPAQAQVAMRVPAETSARVRPRRVHNGQAVTFTGQMRALPVPAGGKLVEVQVKLSGHWQTFRTTRSDQAGRWASRYRFRRTRGVQRYQFRVQLPREAGYPFETGMTRVLTVRVSGP
jgi:hypothetical protein